MELKQQAQASSLSFEAKHSVVSALLKQLSASLSLSHPAGFRTSSSHNKREEDRHGAEWTEEQKEKAQARRAKIIAEVIETERSYVHQLSTLDELYITPLLRDATKTEAILPLKQCDVLFNNVRSIMSMNEGLLKSLEKGSESEGQNIGQAFLDFVPFFQLYKTYIANHVRANELLSELLSPESSSSSSKFREYHTRCTQDPRAKGLNLTSLLITPIQRVPRYKMLLEEVLKNTHHSHPDRSKLNQALNSVCQAALEINEAVRSEENRALLQDMQDNLFNGKVKLVKNTGPATQNASTPERMFMRRGVLTKVCFSYVSSFFTHIWL